MLEHPQDEAIALPEGGSADEALALHLSEERVELGLERDSRAVTTAVPKRHARGLGEIVQRPIDQVHIFDVEADAAALQQVEKVRARLLRHFPDRAGLDGDVTRLFDVLEDGDGVAR